ncbi:hypothetical protein ACJJIG_04275 [Microbulbifer sp. SSSA007]|uniref:hypothetical protein n=1 Tax=Microbulbifer sp. SSSA007 TaxID=3243379 RepID=UPI00403933C8
MVYAGDGQNTVQTHGAGDPMSSVYVTTKTLQTDGDEAVNVSNHIAGLASEYSVKVANRLAVHSSITTMAIPSS